MKILGGPIEVDVIFTLLPKTGEESWMRKLDVQDWFIQDGELVLLEKTGQQVLVPEGQYDIRWEPRGAK